MRKVPDKEWDQMKLSDLAKKGNIFDKVKKSMIDELQLNAEKRSREDAQKGGRPQPLKFSETKKVDNFTPEALEKKEEKEAIRRTGAAFEKKMQELVKSHQEVRPKSDAELFQEVSNGAKDIYRAINSADPALMRSSRQYREMKQEADRLRKLTQSVTKKIQEGGKPKAEETAEMLTSLGILNAKTAEYLDYKLDQVQGDEKRLTMTFLP